jgi:hypothetical protein
MYNIEVQKTGESINFDCLLDLVAYLSTQAADVDDIFEVTAGDISGTVDLNGGIPKFLPNCLACNQDFTACTKGLPINPSSV